MKATAIVVVVVVHFICIIRHMQSYDTCLAHKFKRVVGQAMMQGYFRCVNVQLICILHILLTVSGTVFIWENGPNHMSGKIGRYKVTRPIQTQLGQYRRNSAVMTQPVTMSSSASFLNHTNMADMV